MLMEWGQKIQAIVNIKSKQITDESNFIVMMTP